MLQRACQPELSPGYACAHGERCIGIVQFERTACHGAQRDEREHGEPDLRRISVGM